MSQNDTNEFDEFEFDDLNDAVSSNTAEDASRADEAENISIDDSLNDGGDYTELDSEADHLSEFDYMQDPIEDQIDVADEMHNPEGVFEGIDFSEFDDEMDALTDDIIDPAIDDGALSGQGFDGSDAADQNQTDNGAEQIDANGDTDPFSSTDDEQSNISADHANQSDELDFSFIEEKLHRDNEPNEQDSKAASDDVEVSNQDEYAPEDTTSSLKEHSKNSSQVDPFFDEPFVSPEDKSKSPEQNVTTETVLGGESKLGSVIESNDNGLGEHAAALDANPSVTESSSDTGNNQEQLSEGVDRDLSEVKMGSDELIQDPHNADLRADMDDLKRRMDEENISDERWNALNVAFQELAQLVARNQESATGSGRSRSNDSNEQSIIDKLKQAFSIPYQENELHSETNSSMSKTEPDSSVVQTDSPEPSGEFDRFMDRALSETKQAALRSSGDFMPEAVQSIIDQANHLSTGPLTPDMVTAFEENISWTLNGIYSVDPQMAKDLENNISEYIGTSQAAKKATIDYGEFGKFAYDPLDDNSVGNMIEHMKGISEQSGGAEAVLNALENNHVELSNVALVTGLKSSANELVFDSKRAEAMSLMTDVFSEKLSHGQTDLVEPEMIIEMKEKISVIDFTALGAAMKQTYENVTEKVTSAIHSLAEKLVNQKSISIG